MSQIKTFFSKCVKLSLPTAGPVRTSGRNPHWRTSHWEISSAIRAQPALRYNQESSSGGLEMLPWRLACTWFYLAHPAKKLGVSEPWQAEALHSLPLNLISESTATLQLASHPLLHVPRTRTVDSSRAFIVAAPTLWNSLPVDITNIALLTVFRNNLKTFLFYHTPSGCSAD